MATPDEYVRTFDARGGSYNRATAGAPLARSGERACLLELLHLRPDHVVCDVPAGGGYVADGVRTVLRTPAQIVCIEPSPAFAAALDPAYVVHLAPLDAWPVADASVDRVASLAGLHHVDQKTALFGEAARALRAGGRMAVGDVQADTAPARFLDGPVHRYTTAGHRGRFVRAGELTALLERAGFVDVEETHRRCHWRFTSVAQMVEFCRTLFGMVTATPGEVADALYASFAVREQAHEILLPWSLTFAAGRRAR